MLIDCQQAKQICCKRDWNYKKEQNRNSGAEKLSKWDEGSESLGNRTGQMEDRFGDLKDRNLEIIQVKGENW